MADNLLSWDSLGLSQLRRAESNHLPPGYEPGELPVLYSARRLTDCPWLVNLDRSGLWAWAELERTSRQSSGSHVDCLIPGFGHIGMWVGRCRRSLGLRTNLIVRHLGRTSEVSRISPKRFVVNTGLGRRKRLCIK